MRNLTKEYLLLFNAITDAEECLRQVRSTLMAAQQQAEELYMDKDEPCEDQQERLHDAS